MISDDEKSAGEEGDVDWNECAHTEGHCVGCAALIGSPYLSNDERRRVGCCRNGDDCHAFRLEVTTAIRSAIDSNLTVAQARYHCYRHLVLNENFGTPIPQDPEGRLLLDCCILFRVRCTFPSPTGQYTGHRDLNGFKKWVDNDPNAAGNEDEDDE